MLHLTPNAMKCSQGLVRVIPMSDTHTLHWHLGVVGNEQDFPHFDGQVKGVKREVGTEK